MIIIIILLYRAAVLNRLRLTDHFVKFFSVSAPPRKKFQFSPQNFRKIFFSNYTKIHLFPIRPTPTFIQQKCCNFYVYTIQGPVWLLSSDRNENNQKI